MRKKILVAMSGGVDSSTAAALLKSQGHDVIGVTMQLLDYREAEGGCCSFDQVVDARRVAAQIGIPHYVVNYMDVFEKRVIRDFVGGYAQGRTPVPCVLCNQFVKFQSLLKRALELGCDCLATGHYARVEKAEGNGKFHLKKAFDGSKDQSYFLFTLAQNELKHVLFPLGGMRKSRVRDIAKDMGITVSDKADSSGVCFIPTGNYRDFLQSRGDIKRKKGQIIDVEGNLLGYHDGIHGFTVGQRRGLGISKGKPLYVVKLETEKNTVVVGEEKHTYKSRFIAGNFSWIDRPPTGKTDVKAKIRYRHVEDDASFESVSDGEALIEFKTSQRSITPGQAVVFYDDDRVLGGGWIKEVLQ